MASVLTDQYRSGSVAVPLAGLLTGAQNVQFKTPYSETGNFVVKLPTPDGAVDAFNSTTVVNKYQRYRAILLFNVKTTSTVNVTVNLTVTDSAGSFANLGSSGAIAVNSTTSTGRLEVDFLIDPTATANTAGTRKGVIGPTIIAEAAVANISLVQNNSAPVSIGVGVLGSAADAGAVFTVNELSLELL
jgi:hypothetical protein